MTIGTSQVGGLPCAKGITLMRSVWKAAWPLLLFAASAGSTLACIRLTAGTDGKAGLEQRAARAAKPLSGGNAMNTSQFTTDNVHSLPSQAGEGSASPSVQQVSSGATQGNAWFENYRFRDGGTLPRLRLHFATLGTPHRNAQDDIDNAVLVIHWTGASGSVLLGTNYMKALFDPGRPLDARRHYLIFSDNVGHGQSSKPSDGLKASFPSYGYRDIVDLQHKLVTDTLGIKHLHAILGISMGGMNAWQWAEAYPDAMDGVMPVVSLPIKVSGRNLLWRRMVIGAIRSDPEWNDGNYNHPPAGWQQGYEILRMMIDGVPHLQSIVPDVLAADRFIADARQQAAAADANDLLYSLKSSADYDPEPALSSIKTKVFALNFADDEFNPQSLQVLERLMPQVQHGRFVVQPGSEMSCGHMTMAHPELWANYVGEFLRELGDPRSGEKHMSVRPNNQRDTVKHERRR
jgi:homoserine O-acetyltransferase/O-succinyltransferase